VVSRREFGDCKRKACAEMQVGVAWVAKCAGNVGVLCVFGDGNGFVVGLVSVGVFGWAAW